MLRERLLIAVVTVVKLLQYLTIIYKLIRVWIDKLLGLTNCVHKENKTLWDMQLLKNN